MESNSVTMKENNKALESTEYLTKIAEEVQKQVLSKRLSKCRC